MVTGVLGAKTVKLQYACPPSLRNRSVVAVIGTFDPIVPANVELFRALAKRGRQQKLLGVVIVLFPSPAQLVNGAAVAPQYSDIHSRVALIRMSAPVDVLVVRFSKPDLDASCASFFRFLGRYIRVRELWLGPNQSLGRGWQGSRDRISELARCRNIRIKWLAPYRGRDMRWRVMKLLQEGKVRKASTFASFPPIWRRPQNSILKLHWPAGRYLVVAVAAPSVIHTVANRFAIRLRGSGNRSQTFSWPNRNIEWLAFLAGPAEKFHRKYQLKFSA